MRLNLVFFLFSIIIFGQTKITWLSIENLSSKLYGNTEINFEHPESIFYPKAVSQKKDKVFVSIKMNLKSNKDFQKIVYLSVEDFKIIETKILELNSKDIFNNLGCLDGYQTILKMGNSNSTITFDVYCLGGINTNFDKIINLVLEKLKIKKEEFYR
ncbi:hypothetical protein [Chishuiella sp.]|uniref:hypothetical protein n=1 Tax=Chishuiella sp. TaxID=1969467 RepID=UPI0028AE3A7A|nr:hypothetical protein [Chishuiella sp.]